MSEPKAPDDEGAFGNLTPDGVRVLEELGYRMHRRIVAEARTADEWSYSLLCGIHHDLFGALFPDIAGALRRREVSLRDYPVPRPAQIVYRLTDIVTNAVAMIGFVPTLEDVAERTTAAMRLAARLHTDCVVVQPFLDGNKRWALHVLNALLIDIGYWPGTSLDLFGVRSRERYLSAIDRAVANDPDPLAELILRGWLASRERYRG